MRWQEDITSPWKRVSPPIGCSMAHRWYEILEETDKRDPKMFTGGLGSLTVPSKYEAWVCSMEDKCAPANDMMCYIYNEISSTFEPWGLNSDLQVSA